ncbi:hypothetical protein QQ045_025083 [Rhodiola kirilowii]
MPIDLETKRIGASASFGTVDRLGRASGFARFGWIWDNFKDTHLKKSSEDYPDDTGLSFGCIQQVSFRESRCQIESSLFV